MRMRTKTEEQNAIKAAKTISKLRANICRKQNAKLASGNAYAVALAARRKHLKLVNLANKAKSIWIEKMRKYDLAVIKLDEAVKTQTLETAAMVARRMGFAVSSSKNGAGTICSYYLKSKSGTIRISDHELPSNARRDFYGGHPEIIIDRFITAKRIRRLIRLADESNRRYSTQNKENGYKC